MCLADTTLIKSSKLTQSIMQNTGAVAPGRTRQKTVSTTWKYCLQIPWGGMLDQTQSAGQSTEQTVCDLQDLRDAKGPGDIGDSLRPKEHTAMPTKCNVCPSSEMPAMKAVFREAGKNQHEP